MGQGSHQHGWSWQLFAFKNVESKISEKKVGSVSERFYGIPTDYSQRRTLEDANQILNWCGEDDVDALLLVPVWPVCHQVVSLAARTFEEGGIPTSSWDLWRYRWRVWCPPISFHWFPWAIPAENPGIFWCNRNYSIWPSNFWIRVFAKNDCPNSFQLGHKWMERQLHGCSWRDLEALALAGEERRKSQDEKRRSGMKRWKFRFCKIHFD